MEISVLATEWSRPNFDITRKYFDRYPQHVAGVIIIPGAYGIKKGGNLEWPKAIDSNDPAALTQFFNQADEATIKNYETQLCCAVFIPLDNPFEIKILCSQIDYQNLRELLSIMTAIGVPLYLSPLDLAELCHTLDLQPRINPDDLRTLVRINRDRAALAKMLWYLLESPCQDLLLRHLDRS